MSASDEIMKKKKSLFLHLNWDVCEMAVNCFQSTNRTPWKIQTCEKITTKKKQTVIKKAHTET